MRSLQTNRNGAFKALLLAGGASALVMAGPALAQDEEEGEGVLEQPTTADPNASGPPAPAADTIIVTGSRIVRQDFEANSPIVTVDEALFQNSSTSAIESNLNKLPQFVPAQTPTAGGDIQPTATNTPGAATVSLRGIGANRNLVLLDGRRATPSNASMVVDISTIPSAAIERTEIISGGASATYGADAVAGVTNFILKKNFVGLELDGQASLTQEGDGLEFQLSGIMGTDFDDGRGNISFAMSMNKRDGSFQRDREWYRDLWTDPQVGGTAFFNSAPGFQNPFFPANTPSAAALETVFGTTNPPFPAAGSSIYFNPDGTAWAGSDFAARGAADDFNMGELDGFPWKQTAIGTIGYNNTNLYLILPLTRYNAFARGNYEINDWIGVFGQALFSKTSTYTRNEPGPITGGWDVFVPYGTGVYVGSQAPQQQPPFSFTGGNVLGTGNPSSVILNGMSYNFGTYTDPTPGDLADNPTNPAFTDVYGGQFACANNALGGCTNNQVIGQFLPDEMQYLLDSRPYPNAPFQMQSYMPDDRETFTDVQTFSLLTGFEGSIPGTDWTWEVFVNHGESATFARQTGVYSLERVQTLLSAPGFGRGFSRTGNQESGGFGASTGTCTSGVNFYDPPEGGFSEDCLEAMRADLKNRSKMRQTIWEANFQGGIVDLWAGQVRGALGASYRENDYEFINDTLTTQGRSFLDQALGIYPSGDAFGKIDVKEIYGELLIPLLADVPFVQEFNLEVGGRISDYNTTGVSYTYKLNGDWAVNDWLRFRGGYNRAERAPNIGELFLAAQQTFGINNRGDVCSQLNPFGFSANPAVNPNASGVEAVCRTLMEQSGNTGADEQYYSQTQSTSAFGFAFPTLVGNPNLVPEVADTWTAGVVVQSPMVSGPLSRLRLSVDWYDITIKDAIGAQTIGAVQQQCFDPLFNPAVADAAFDPSGTDGTPNAAATEAANNQFCQLLPRNQTGALGNVFITYANSGRVHLQGIDAQLDWGMDIGPGMLTLNSVFNYQMDFESSALFPQIPLVDYVGTTGSGENGLNNNVFEYRIFTTVGYNLGPARIAVQWQHYPSLEDGGEAAAPTPNTAPYPSYDIFALNGSYSLLDNVTLRFGVDNLFNKRPPLGSFNPNADNSAGQLRGGSFLTGVHDTNGRRFYLGANVRF